MDKAGAAALHTDAALLHKTGTPRKSLQPICIYLYIQKYFFNATIGTLSIYAFSLE